ncbi:MAG: hypothetical protein D3916_16735 [Candidatus Electrothrix sp. MAN1_4]|nr:hypothetical protein [Candidatus Electrothrix sp. MAN1_4]
MDKSSSYEIFCCLFIPVKAERVDVFCPARPVLLSCNDRNRGLWFAAPVILMRETIGMDFEKSRDKAKKKCALNVLKLRKKKKKEDY